MAVVLYLLSGITFFMGSGFFSGAKGAIHEIEGLICFLISTIFFTSGAIVYAVHTMRKPLPEQRKCPHCIEMIHTDAVKCRYCQSDLTLPAVTPAQVFELATNPAPDVRTVFSAYPVEVFRDDDAGYTAWLQQHPDGSVVDVYRHRPQSHMLLHQATCAIVQPGREGGTGGQFFKACCTDTAALTTWAALQGYKKDFVTCAQCGH